MNLFHRSLDMQRDLTQMESAGNLNDDVERGHLGRRVWYYIGAMYQGQPLVLGRWSTPDQADAVAYRKLGDVPYKVYPKTCDRATATREIKYDLLSPDNIDQVLQRARHQVVEPDEDEA